MIGDVNKIFTKLLHLTEPWQVTSVAVNDDQTRVDIRVSIKDIPQDVCKCGCIRRCYDKREREWQHTDLFDMKCHIHCCVPRMKCMKCEKIESIDVPWTNKNNGFTLLFESKV